MGLQLLFTFLSLPARQTHGNYVVRVCLRGRKPPRAWAVAAFFPTAASAARWAGVIDTTQLLGADGGPGQNCSQSLACVS